MRKPIGRLGRMVLLVLLLTSQGLVLAHEIDHLGIPDAGACVTCTVHAGSDGLAGTGEYSLIPGDSHSAYSESSNAIVIPQRNCPKAARAPPVTL
jgi:hypothetical protein